MSGMHLLPAYWNTNNHKKRKKKRVTEKMAAAIAEHEKYLKRMGYNPSHKAKAPPPKTERVSVALPQKNISEYDWSPCLRGQKYTLTKSYNIGQAYNKGGLVVLSEKEASDASTGKRR